MRTTCEFVITRAQEGVNKAPTLTSFFFFFNFITNIRQLDLIRSILCVLGHIDSKMYTAKNV